MNYRSLKKGLEERYNEINCTRSQKTINTLFERVRYLFIFETKNPILRLKLISTKIDQRLKQSSRVKRTIWPLSLRIQIFQKTFQTLVKDELSSLRFFISPLGMGW